LANLKVDPPVTIASLNVVLLNEFRWNVSNFNVDVFGVWHWSIKVEVLEVNGAETCTWARQHAVEMKLDMFREADAIAVDCYAGSIRIICSGCTLHTTMVWQISSAYGMGCHGS
jgi:hypothetical protein